MYFWKTNELKEKLQDKPLTDREVLPYFIIFIISMSIPFSDSWEGYNFWDYFDELHLFLIPILGTIYAYLKNNGKNGTYFLQRYLSLGWVLCIRFTVLLILILLSFLLIDYFIPGFLHSNTQWFESLIFLGVQVVYYYRLGFHIGNVAIAFSNKSINSD